MWTVGTSIQQMIMQGICGKEIAMYGSYLNYGSNKCLKHEATGNINNDWIFEDMLTEIVVL